MTIVLPVCGSKYRHHFFNLIRKEDRSTGASRYKAAVHEAIEARSTANGESP